MLVPIVLVVSTKNCLETNYGDVVKFIRGVARISVRGFGVRAKKRICHRTTERVPPVFHPFVFLSIPV